MPHHKTEPNATTADPGSGDSRVQRRRILSFVTMLAAILLTASWGVCATWNHFRVQPTMPPWQFALILLPVSFIPATILGLRHSNVLLRFWYRVSAVSVGVLSFFVVAAVACWVVYAAAALFGVRLDPRSLGAALFGLAALASGYGIVNASRIHVTRITVKIPGLPDAWHARTTALVSDLHLGNLRGAAFSRRVATQLQRLHPEAVFIGGDLFDGGSTRLDLLVEPWATLNVPGGVYYVTGNHEEFTDRKKYIDAVARTGIRVLNNEMVSVDGLQIIGVHDGEASDPGFLREVLQRVELDRNRASILLAHQPANLSIAEIAGVSLQLSGHTHGGQFWPWSWLISRAHGRFAYGLNRAGNMQVLTTSGTGTWGPPVRFGTRSEIVLIQFERTSQ